MSGFGVFKRTLYSGYPSMQNASDIYVSSCACGVDNFFRCTVNNFDYIHDYTVFGLPLCGFSHGYWCSGIENGSCNFSGKSAYVYYSDNNGWLAPTMTGSSDLYPLGSMSSFLELRNSDGTNKLLLFHHNYDLPLNVSTYDIESAILEAMPDFPSLNRINEYCRGEWVPHDEDCFGTEQEVETALGDSVYFCSSLGGKTSYSKELSNRGWCVVGECEFDDIIVSSSSEYVSSSSSDEISSSSSESSNCPPHPLASVPSNPLSACFEKNGTCYKCNSARGNECSNNWLWIYDFVESNIGWWYSEVDCNSGSDNYSSSSEVSSSSNYESSSSGTTGGIPGSSSGSSICPAHPLSSVPSNPLSACFEKNGTCYKCNSARGNECSNNWLWIYDFVPGNVGWWYEEVSCEEEKNECPDGTASANLFLSKNGVFEDEAETSDYDISYEIWGNKTKFYYDAIGRKTQNDPDTRRYLFEGKNKITTNTEMWNSLEMQPTICYKSNGEWVCEEKQKPTLRKIGDPSACDDYGFMKEDGTIDGGVTCPVIETYARPSRYRVCQDDRSKIQIDSILISTELIENKIFYVEENDTIKNSNYVVTKEDETAMYYHELGHQKYNSCLKFPRIVKQISDCYCDTTEIRIRVEQERIEIQNKRKNMVDSISNLFHEHYGDTGYARTYSCP